MTRVISRSKRQLQDAETLHAVNAVKMVSLLALRNEGWSTTRLKRFSNKFNEIVTDVSNEHLTLTDIMDTIFKETGLDLNDLKVQ